MQTGGVGLRTELEDDGDSPTAEEGRVGGRAGPRSGGEEGNVWRNALESP